MLKRISKSGVSRELPALLLAAGLLAGCTASEGDSTSRFLVAPGKYVLFNCAQIQQQATQNGNRQRELEALMLKAGDDSAGRLVSAMAYKPEYYQLRGEMADLRREALEKKCKFVPAEAQSARPVGSVPSR
jgi:hypothetical protein